MNSPAWEIVFLGLSITSSWGNRHSGLYRGLIRELVLNGHRVLFLERDRPWFAAHRDPLPPVYGRIETYNHFEEMKKRFGPAIRRADVVIAGSALEDGIRINEWILKENRQMRVYYDLDAPRTLSRLLQRDCEYLAPDQIGRFDLFLSAGGGASLEQMQSAFGAARIAPLYPAIDPESFYPEPQNLTYTLGHLGRFQAERREAWERHFLEPARRLPEFRFLLAGMQFPRDHCPDNVIHLQYLAPAHHRNFFNAQRYYLDLQSGERRRSGWAPTLQLFQAAACGVPVITESWPGLEQFFTPGREVLVTPTADVTVDYLRELPEGFRRRIAMAGRARVLAEHTFRKRALQLEAQLAGGGRRVAADPERRLAAPAPPSWRMPL